MRDLGRHLFLVQYYRQLTVYIDGQQAFQHYVEDSWNSPDDRDTFIVIGEEFKIYDMGEIKYYFKNVQDQQVTLNVDH